jgi:Dolichyl-phosphate-mannose-protein mannosyltransferase
LTIPFAPSIEATASRRIVISRAFLIDLGIVAALLVVTFWRLLPAVESTPFHRDEARWVGNSALLREWRHPIGIKWQDEGYPDQYGSLDERNRRRSQPPFAMYVFGVGLLLQGRDLPHIGYWIMDHDTEWNTEHGNMPSPGDLRAARRTSVFIAGLTVVALFVIGTRLTNRVGGVAGALIYALHPLVLATSSRALSDALLVLCVALAAVAAIRFVARPTWSRAALVGLLLGLGGATKLSPLAVAIAVGGLGIVLLGSALLWRGESAPRLRQIGVRLLAVPVVAALVFVAVYPYLWTDPIDHAQRMFDFRTESFRLQEAISPDAKLANRAAAFRRVGAELGVRMSTGGVIAEKLESRFNFGDWIWLRDLDLMLAIAGWILFIGLAVRRGWNGPTMLIAAIIGGQALLIIMSVSIVYIRYFLPVLLAVAIGAGISCGVAWDWGVRLATTRLGREPRVKTQG